jgi:hypothetical protein
MKKDAASVFVHWCLGWAVVLVLALGVSAQIQNGQLTGVVTDPTGASIPNATVKVTNEGTSLATTVQTGDSGIYIARELPVGKYKVTVEASGFKTASTTAEINAGTILRADFKMQVGQTSEIVEVTDVSPPVNTEDSKLASIVGAAQVASLPLNGRNIYDLIRLAPGSLDYSGGGNLTSEQGPTTVVNGTRQNFNGFLINGVANKDLSGGPNNQPIQDTVQEFQLLTLNMSAQYGNSAGSVTNLVTKTGTNAFHGSGWWFHRNDKLDANEFFLNQASVPKNKLRFNQFGGTFGGPIKKDKLFFFVAYQGDRLITGQPSQSLLVESPAFVNALQTLSTTDPLFQNNVALFLMQQFPPNVPGAAPGLSINDYVGGGFGFSGSFADYFCPDVYPAAGPGSQIPSTFAALFGYSPADDDLTACSTTANAALGVPYQAGAISRDVPFLLDSVLRFGAGVKDNLFHGNEASARIDYNIGPNDRIFGQYNWQRTDDRFGAFNASLSASRGFRSPARTILPNGQFSYIHTFSPTVLNEFKAGYTLGITSIQAGINGVPQVAFDDGVTAGFGSYNGYPQFFKGHVYTYSDMVSISKGKHNLKMGADFRRNIENSEFNVGRPSYYFFDPLFFAAGAPYRQAAGVDPGIVAGVPSQLATNIRHWRNLEFGAYFQDDWKITGRLTLNLGLRYDLYSRHKELDDLATTFILGPGSDIIDDLTTGAGQIHDANTPCLFLPSGAVRQDAQVAGVCGSGGFAATSQLGGADHNNFGPRVGFAWDVWGNGKTSLRGGFGVSYEGTLYNPLSNSRWNPPFYSFNRADNFLLGGISYIVWGPTVCTPQCQPDLATAPSFTGTATNPGQGVGVQAVGNLVGWDPNNPNLAFRSGLVFQDGLRDPYVYSYYLGVQRELAPKTVLELNYVGTAGRKLFRAEDVNRIPGGLLPLGECITDNLGRQLCGQVDVSFYPGTTIPINRAGVLNPNYGQLRNWRNVVNSSYNALQASLKLQSWRGLIMNVNYTWSHSIDGGSAWHNSATTGNGAAAGDGFTTDYTLPGLDRGNSVFDVRHRLLVSYIYELPFLKNHGGWAEAAFGGWQLNGIWNYQSGLHWSAFRSSAPNIGNPFAQTGCYAVPFNPATCTNTGGDYNLDGLRIDRPNYSGPTTFSHDQWANGIDASAFTSPCLGCVGNLGRNALVGPNLWGVDMSLFKTIKITERFNLQFRAEGFNVFNRANFLLPGANFAGRNRINSPAFGQAAGTLNPRQLQFGLKLSF